MSTDGGSVWKSVDKYYSMSYDLAWDGKNTLWSAGIAAPDSVYHVVLTETLLNTGESHRHILYSDQTVCDARVAAVSPGCIDLIAVGAVIRDEPAFFLTEDRGATWGRKTADGLMGEPLRLLFHPSEDGVMAMVSTSGLFVSGDHGETWEAITGAYGDLVDATLSSSGNSLYLGSTSGGIWEWLDWGATPVLVGEVPGMVQTLVHSADRNLYAGTGSRSVWLSTSIGD